MVIVDELEVSREEKERGWSLEGEVAGSSKS